MLKKSDTMKKEIKISIIKMLKQNQDEAQLSGVFGGFLVSKNEIPGKQSEAIKLQDIGINPDDYNYNKKEVYLSMINLLG